MKRFLAIWFPWLVADRLTLLDPDLHGTSFVTTTTERGKILIKAVSTAAMKEGISPGMMIADVLAIAPSIKIVAHSMGIEEKLLTSLAEWCLQFTPVVAIDPPDGLLLDISGCPHLWGGELAYMTHIKEKIAQKGFSIQCAIADTVAAAWALSRYKQDNPIIPPGGQSDAVAVLPPSALRLEATTTDRLQKLGLSTIGSFSNIAPSVLRRRFGDPLLTRLNQIHGTIPELLQIVQPVVMMEERLPCLEPVITRMGIDIALKTLLEVICLRLTQESKGLRTAVFKCFGVDGMVQQISIGTNRPVRSVSHLMKLFEYQIASIYPGLGLETFVLEAPVTEELMHKQEALWSILHKEKAQHTLSDLVDRISEKLGSAAVRRYVPTEQHWPERSYKKSVSVFETESTDWHSEKRRPIIMLRTPVGIQVTVPIPDYPPMIFIHKGKVHRIKKADGPERIEREWWLEKGLVRDYYCLEDEQGARYWVFRSGHYEQQTPEWFIHGYFA